MKRIAPVILVFAFLAAFAAAQLTRATLTGRVTDPTGAILPHAQIVITNMDNGAKTVVLSNSAGVYTVPYLEPGRYSEKVSLSGFKTYIHTGLVLRTEQTVTENIVMQVGSVNASVTVHGATPLINVANADMGQTLTATQVADLPSNGRSPLGFAHLEYGAVAKGKHSMVQTRPFDNNAADDFSLGGGASSSNELLLNGVPNMQDSQRTAGYSPELDAVKAVHVDEFSANAAMGDTSGGFVNITTKAGTNQLHGTASEYYSGSRPFTAKPYFTPAGKSTPSTHFNQFAGTIGGPIVIPHVINGHNKLFFFYAYEGYKGNSPGTIITSVPTAAERQGDFHDLYTLNANNQLYDPNSGVLDPNTGLVSRTAIPNNCLNGTSSYCSTVEHGNLPLSPIAQAYLKLVPLPNITGATDGENNFFAADPTANKYTSNEGRVDYNVSASDKAFFEFHRSHFVTTRQNYFNNVLTGGTATMNLLGGQVDNVKSFSPTLTQETRLGFSRTENFSGPNSLGLSPTSYGFPGYLAGNSTVLALPSLSFSDSASIPGLSSKPGNVEDFDDIQLFTDLTKIVGRHTLQFGTDFRVNKKSYVSPGNADGDFTFKSSNGDFVTAGTGAPSQPFGGAFALFDLGLPTSGSYDINTRFQYNNWYFAFFGQDDWKVMPNLTISTGIRLEHETPLVESNNQMVAGWNPTQANAVTAPALAAYKTAPNSMLPVSQFSATGGMIYATSGNRGAYSTAPLYISPRIGFAYAPGFGHNRLAIRGGIGIYVNPFTDYYNGQSYGFSQSTSFITSTNNGVSPTSTLTDPFPTSNPIVHPFGSSLGINTNLGSSVKFWYPNSKVQYTEKWSLDIQKQLGKTWLVEVGYLGSHQVHNFFTNDLSAVPLLPYLSHQATYDKTLTDQMSAKTANPFYGIIPGPETSLNSNSKISVASLLHAYPEYSDVVEGLIPAASANFNAIMFRFGKQMSHGLDFNFNYEYSRQLGYETQLNPGGPLSYEETSSDFPSHASLIALYQLPFGRGREFLNQAPRALDEVVGGWELTSIYQYLSGTALGWGNMIYTGNWHDFHNNPHHIGGASFNVSNFDCVATDPNASKVQPNGYNYRTFPKSLLRSDPTKDFDFSLLKDFTIGDRVIVQPRFDAFNAFNRPQFKNANTNPKASSFGYITSQMNSGRQLQAGIHILF